MICLLGFGGCLCWIVCLVRIVCLFAWLGSFGFDCAMLLVGCCCGFGGRVAGCELFVALCVNSVVITFLLFWLCGLVSCWLLACGLIVVWWLF